MSMRFGKLYDRALKFGQAFDSLCDRVIRGDAEVFEKLAGKKKKPSQAGSMLSGSPSSWRPWSGDPYQQIVEYRNWVYTAVRFRALRRQTPPLVVRYVAPETREKYLHERRTGAIAAFPRRRFIQKSVKPAGARVGTDLEYLPADSPAMQLLHNPNDPQIGIDLWFMASIFEDLTGRCHIWKVRNGAGQVIELWVIPTPWVEPTPGGVDLIASYKVTMPNGDTETIDKDDMITIGEPSPYGYLAWMSPLQAHGMSVDLYNAIIVSRFNGLVNGANVGTLVTVPSAMANDPIAMQRFENMLMSRINGTTNYNRPLIAEEGAELTNLTPQMETAFSESAKMTRDDIFAAFDLDSQLMGFSEFTTRASAHIVKDIVSEKIVIPYHERRNTTITHKLLITDFDSDLVAINETKKEETPEEKTARIKLMSDTGAISVNEIRQEFDMEPFEDATYDEPILTKTDSMLTMADQKLNQPEEKVKFFNRLAGASTNGVH